MGSSFRMRNRSNSTSSAGPTDGVSAITINEDDAPPSAFRPGSPKSASVSGGRGLRFSGTQGGKMRRCLSLPGTLLDVKSIMRFRTLDESLHSTYGSDNGSKNGNDKPGIRMGQVIIREYGRTVGDNPSCSSGPPVSISWEYNKLGSFDLDEYENSRPPRRSHMDMVLPRKVRQDMLRREWDVTQRQIADAVRRNIKTKNLRKATVNNLGKATRMEEIMESAQRKIKRAVLFRKPTSAQVRDMEAKLNEVARRRAQMKLELQMAGEYNSVSTVGDGEPGELLLGESDDEEKDGIPMEAEAPDAMDTSTSST